MKTINKKKRNSLITIKRGGLNNNKLKFLKPYLLLNIILLLSFNIFGNVTNVNKKKDSSIFDNFFILMTFILSNLFLKIQIDDKSFDYNFIEDYILDREKDHQFKTPISPKKYREKSPEKSSSFLPSKKVFTYGLTGIILAGIVYTHSQENSFLSAKIKEFNSKGLRALVTAPSTTSVTAPATTPATTPATAPALDNQKDKEGNQSSIFSKIGFPIIPFLTQPINSSSLPKDIIDYHPEELRQFNFFGDIFDLTSSSMNNDINNLSNTKPSNSNPISTNTSSTNLSSTNSSSTNSSSTNPSNSNPISTNTSSTNLSSTNSSSTNSSSTNPSNNQDKSWWSNPFKNIKRKIDLMNLDPKKTEKFRIEHELEDLKNDSKKIRYDVINKKITDAFDNDNQQKMKDLQFLYPKEYAQIKLERDEKIRKDKEKQDREQEKLIKTNESAYNAHMDKLEEQQVTDNTQTYKYRRFYKKLSGQNADEDMKKKLKSEDPMLYERVMEDIIREKDPNLKFLSVSELEQKLREKKVEKESFLQRIQDITMTKKQKEDQIAIAKEGLKEQGIDIDSLNSSYWYRLTGRKSGFSNEQLEQISEFENLVKRNQSGGFPIDKMIIQYIIVHIKSCIKVIINFINKVSILKYYLIRSIKILNKYIRNNPEQKLVVLMTVIIPYFLYLRINLIYRSKGSSFFIKGLKNKMSKTFKKKFNSISSKFSLKKNKH